MKSYTHRLTIAQWKAVEAALTFLPSNADAVTALKKIKAANEVLASVRDDDDGNNDDGDNGDISNGDISNGNGNGGESGHTNAMPALSRKELSVLQSLMRGESNKEIARRLVCTESTIKVHMKAVLRKLRLGNRTQAAMWARANMEQTT